MEGREDLSEWELVKKTDVLGSAGTLCFLDAFQAKKNRLITDTEYLGHLVAHFHGARHPEDRCEENGAVASSDHLNESDPVGSAIRDFAFTTTLTAAHAARCEKLFAACFEGDSRKTQSYLFSLPKTLQASLLQALSTLAASKGHTQILQMCLSRGAIFDARVDQATNMSLSPAMLDFLYKVNWKSIRTSRDALSSIVTYPQYRNLDVLRWLWDHGAKVPASHVVSAASCPDTSLEVMRIMIEMCGGVAAVAGTGALQLAAQCGNRNVVALLLDIGVDIDEIPPLFDIREPLGRAIDEAVKNKHDETVRLLLNRGASVDGKNRFGSSTNPKVALNLVF